MGKKGAERKGYWKNRKITTLGMEKRCSRCREWWPLDREFYQKHGKGFHCYCIACVGERCYELRTGAVRNYTLTPIGSI